MEESQKQATHEDLVLRKWNVWYHYSSYLREPVDLRSAAGKFVTSRLCNVAFHSDHTLYWRSGDGSLQRGPVVIERSGYQSHATLTFPKEMRPLLEGGQTKREAYLLECAYGAAKLAFAEQRNLSNFVARDAPHVRGFMDPIMFDREQAQVHLYPQIKLYENGAIILSFRLISPDRPMGSNEFIERFLNLYKFPIDNLYLPPAVVLFDHRNCLVPAVRGAWRRHAFSKRLSALEKSVEALSVEHTTDDFAFPLISGPPEGLSSGSARTLETVREYVVSALIGALNNPRTGREYVLRGQRRERFQAGEFWRGRVNAYLLAFDDQPYRASQIRKRFSAQLAAMLSRISWNDERGWLRNSLPETLRLFEDSTVHLNESVTLVAFAAGAADTAAQNADGDPNDDEIIFDRQVQLEFLDYVALSFRRLEELSLDFARSTATMLSERVQLHQLEGLMSRAARYGEIKYLFGHAWQIFDLKALRASIRENNHLRLGRLNELRDRRWRRVSWVLATAFGLVGTSSLSSEVVDPTWRALEWWLPPPAWEPLFLFSVTAVTVLLILYGLVVVLIAGE